MSTRSHKREIDDAHELQEIVDAGWAPSVLWLQRRLRKGSIPGYKVGRDWVMSDEDLEVFKASVRNTTSHEPGVVERPVFGGLSSASARRRAS